MQSIGRLPTRVPAMLRAAAGLLAVLAAGEAGFSEAQDDAPGPTSSAPSAQKPNVLYILLDQWRWDWAGFHDTGVRAPNVRALADRGTRFEFAYVPAPLCGPSRVAVAAGLSYASSWVQDNDHDYFPAGHGTYVDLLRGEGYATLAAGKDHLNSKDGVGIDGSTAARNLGYSSQRRSDDKYESFCYPAPREPWTAALGAESWAEQRACYGCLGGGSCCLPGACQEKGVGGRKGHMECGFNCPVPSNVDEDNSVDAWVERQAEQLLADHWRDQPGKPWFMSVGFPSPHPPFILSPSENRSAESRPTPPPAWDNNLLDPDAVIESRRQYGQLIERLDGLIGDLMGFLDTHGQRNNTLIVLTADHGEHLGDHGFFGKASAWEPSIRVPIIVAGPRVHQGRVIQEPVSTVDLSATMLEAAGTVPLPEMEAKSLMPLLTAKSATPPREQVQVALSSEREGSNFSALVQRANDTHIYKFVCCPKAELCRKAASLLPAGEEGEAQVALVALSATPPGDVENLLLRDPPVGCIEARKMLLGLPSPYQERCMLPLQRLCASPHTAHHRRLTLV